MQREEFELLGSENAAAIGILRNLPWQPLTHSCRGDPDELAIELSDGRWALSMIRLSMWIWPWLGGTHGEDGRTQHLLNHAEPLYSSTPRSCAAAARLVADGRLNPPNCRLFGLSMGETFGSAVTIRQRRRKSLRRLLCPVSKTEREKILGDLGPPDPPRTQRPAAWKWGEALSLSWILWRPLLWTTSSTGSMARWWAFWATSSPRWATWGWSCLTWTGCRPSCCFFSQLGWALFGVSLVVCVFECGIEYATWPGQYPAAPPSTS